MKNLFLSLALLFAAFACSAQSITFWSNGITPANTGCAADTSVELGLRFQSSVAGTVTGIRFYKGSQNTGTHVGSIWSSSGTLLGSVTFTNETSSGWQQQSLATSVAIAANTVYVVSYTAPSGYYALDTNYFTNAAYTSGVLTAFESGVNGGGGASGSANGVYARPGGTFPSKASTYNSNSYVDIVFQAASGGIANLGWTAVASATSYNVYRSTSPSSGFAIVLQTSSTNATDNTVVPGTTYYYYYTAIVGGMESMPSATLTAVIPTQ